MILVVDVGTTSLKLCVYSASLECLALAESGYSLDTPDASTVQIDPELWWKAFLQSLKKLDYDPAKIEIVSFIREQPRLQHPGQRRKSSFYLLFCIWTEGHTHKS